MNRMAAGPAGTIERVLTGSPPTVARRMGGPCAESGARTWITTVRLIDGPSSTGTQPMPGSTPRPPRVVITGVVPSKSPLAIYRPSQSPATNS